MKIMKKFKKIGLTATATAIAIATPVATAISCGQGSIKRKDAEFDNEVLIQTTWSANNYGAFGTMQKVIKEYNKTQVDKPGFMKVQMKHMEGGYGSVPSNIEQKIKGKDYDTIPNLVVDYPDAIGKLKFNKVELDFAKTKPAIKRDSFDEEFTKINDQIGRVESGGMYAVPLGKSTEMVSIDAPLVKYFLDAVIAAGGKVEKTKNINLIISKGNSVDDKKAIEKIWGDTSKWNQDTLKKLTINDDTFKSFEKMFEFADAIAEAAGLDANRATKWVMGHDAPTNLAYQLAFANVGYDYDKFIFRRAKTGKFDMQYPFLKNSDTNEKKEFKNALKDIIDRTNSGVLKLGGGGSYTSNYLKQHRVAFSIGSTAGYSHNFEKGGQAHTITGANITITGGKVLEVENGVVQTVDKYHNKVVEANPGKYEILVDKGVTSQIKTYLGSERGYMYSTSTTNEIKKLKAIGAIEIVKGKTFLIKESETTKASDGETLQQSEYIALEPVTKGRAGDSKSMIFTQGPSFIGVHNNEREDNGTARFLEWFYNKNNKIDDGHGKKVSIIEFFDKGSNYLTPMKDFFKKQIPSYIKDNDKYSGGAYVAFQTFHKNSSATILDTPVDKFTGNLRTTVVSNLGTAYSTGHQGHQADVDTIYNAIVKDSKSLIDYMKNSKQYFK